MPRRPKVKPVVPSFLSRADLARRIGLKSVRSLSGMRLPPHDVEIGPHKGWKAETVDAWQSARPGRGRPLPPEPIR